VLDPIGPGKAHHHSTSIGYNSEDLACDSEADPIKSKPTRTGQVWVRDRSRTSQQRGMPAIRSVDYEFRKFPPWGTGLGFRH
jgi:hypothetical protein